MVALVSLALTIIGDAMSESAIISGQKSLIEEFGGN